MAERLSSSRDTIDTGPRFSESEAIRLNNLFRGTDTPDMLRSVLRDRLAGEVAIVSSFGAESAVLLRLVAECGPGDPGDLPRDRQAFSRDAGLSRRAGRAARPDQPDRRRTRSGAARRARTTTGCAGRGIPTAAAKSARSSRWPRALAPFDATITGRKGFQSKTRARPAAVRDRPHRTLSGRLKINPLATGRRHDLDAYVAGPRSARASAGGARLSLDRLLAVHQPVAPGEDPRSGRWKGWDKTECGIHVPGQRRQRAASCRRATIRVL